MGQAGADRDRKIRCGDLFQIEFDHDVFGDLPALGGPVLQALKPSLHLGNPAFKPGGERFIGQSRADDGGDDLMQVGEALYRVGEGLIIDLGVFGSDAVAQGAVGDGGKCELNHDLPLNTR